MKRCSTQFRTFIPAFFLFIQLTHGQNYNLNLRATLDFPDRLANLWGYDQGNREYALVGASRYTAIVDISNPDAPKHIAQIVGPYSTWREIKTYRHYAYVSTEGGGGIQIIDLSALPSDTLNYYAYTGDGPVAGQLKAAHTLQIDTTTGFLYTFGDNINGGATVFDLNQDPYHPHYVGRFTNLGYIHDGYVDNDTLYAAHIYGGVLSVVDMRDKSHPEVLGTIETPGRFTHSAWPLKDRKHVLSLDENYPSFLTCYDISDPSDMQELDRIATTPNGRGSIGHNTHVRGDWAVNSWYTDGLTIVDLHRPDFLVQVGRYDTYPDKGKYDGCWGVYPYLRSGNIIASNISVSAENPVGRLFIFTPTYKPACYLKGRVTDACTGLPMKEVTISITDGDPYTSVKTGNNGIFRTGQTTSGHFEVVVSKPGFTSQTIEVFFEPGKIKELEIELEPITAYLITGSVLDAITGQPIRNTEIVLNSDWETYHVITDGLGRFSQHCANGIGYEATARAWGYLPGRFQVERSSAVLIYLQPGYYDDFNFDLGWTVSGSAQIAGWQRADPADFGFTYENADLPDTDIPTDAGQFNYLSVNSHGVTSLQSPVMHLAGCQDAVMSFAHVFYLEGDADLGDFLRVMVSNGRKEVVVYEKTNSTSGWNYFNDCYLAKYLPLTDSMHVRFIFQNTATTNAMAAAIDVFQVKPVCLPSVADSEPSLQVFPNPSDSNFSIWYDWQQAADLTVKVVNSIGQTVWSEQLPEKAGQIILGKNWPSGIYFVTFQSAGYKSKSLKMIKQ